MLSSNLVAPPPILAARSFRREALLLYGGLCLILAASMVKASGNIVDLDIWHQMSLARETWHAGHLPLHDDLAYTPTLPLVVHHEWGAGVIALAIWNSLGGSGLMLWNFAVAAAAFCLVLAAARRRGVSAWTLAACGILMAPLIAGGYEPVRAQAYGFLFVSGAIYCAERDRAGSRGWIAAWLLLYPISVNVHASCVLGFVVFGLLWLERPSWRIAGVLAGMAALLFVNPYGTDYVIYLLRAVPKTRPLIDEWHPVWTSEMFPLVAVTCGLLVYALAVLRPRARWTSAVLVLLFAAQAVLHRKMIPYFALAWQANVPAWLEKTRLWQDVEGILAENKKLLRPACALVLAACTVYAASTRPWVLRIPDRDARPSYPVGPVRFLKSTGFHGRLLAHFEQSAYISWELGPAVKVAVDSRYEAVYPDSVVEAAVRVYQTGEYAPFTSQYPTDLILTQARYEKLEASLAVGGWKPLYRDGEHTLWQAP